ncbi:MAG: hypothetical protein ABT940_10640, partial [Alphaproteobacteria bacterium]
HLLHHHAWCGGDLRWLATTLTQVLSIVDGDDVLVPILVLSGLVSHIVGLEVVVSQALERNTRLDADERQAAQALFTSLAALMASPRNVHKGRLLMLGLTSGVREYDRPRIFSFLAWKAGEVTQGVRTVPTRRF